MLVIKSWHFAIAFLTVYFSVLPGFGECQPLIFLFFGVLSTFRFISRFESMAMSRFSVLLSLSILPLLFYAVFSLLLMSGDLFVLVKYLVALFVFLGCLTFFNAGVVDIGALRLITVVLCGVAFFQLFYIPFLSPSLSFFLEIIMPRASDSMAAEGRGITLLAPEQSYSAIVLAVLLVWLEVLNRLVRVRSREYHFLKLAILCLLLLTQALLGMVVCFIYLLVKYVSFRHSLVLAILLVFLVFFALKNARVLALLGGMSSIFSPLVGLEVLSSVEPSGTTRIILASANIKSGFEVIPGGVGHARADWSNSLREMGMGFVASHEILGAQFLSNAPTESQTLFLGLIGDFGWLSIPFVFCCLLNFPKFCTNREAFFGVNVLFLMMVYQSGITSPYFFIIFIGLYRLVLFEKCSL